MYSAIRPRLAVLALAFVVAAGSMPASAADGKDAKAGGSLPLKKLVLFNSGVGFFEHRADVQGDAAIDLKFNVKDINDLLKSMVLQDLGGGRISTVTYGSKDPITKTLQTFAIDLTSNPTLGQILNQARGERARVEAPNPITGVILGVETRKKQLGKDQEALSIEFLNLLTEDGLLSVPMESVGRIKLLDERLDAELRQALQVLAMGHSTDKKTVTLNFLGEGKRPVRVGYIQETPVWKTSYRLVLSDDEAPFLQGWAIVENTTEEDWDKVDLTLVSGRPISFIMNLYDPLYVGRPTVEPELYASLRPQTYGQDLAGKDREFLKRAEAEQAEKPNQLARRGAMGGMGGGMGGMLGDAKGVGRTANGAAANAAADKSEKAVDAPFSLQQGVQSSAQATNVGELFQYAIATPVNLPRQKSAMLPIVNESVKGEKLSIYNPAVQAKHPLNGLRLKNSTELHLMQGPITVFDGGAYAGDARIEDLQPGTERLLSYALDLDTEVAPISRNLPEEIVSVRIAKGALWTDRRYRREQSYTVKNSGKKAKKVLIEYPLDTSWKLTAPKEASEKTRAMYRFLVAAEPGKPADLNIEEERIMNQQVALTNLDDNTIAFYLRQKVTGEKVQDALREVIKRKSAVQDVVVRRQQLEQQIAVVDQEQSRIRQNMAQLDRNTDLYKRYVAKFGVQEDKVDSLRTEIRDLQDQETKLRKALDAYLLGLDLS